MTREAIAFVAGWWYGLMVGEASALDAEAEHPEYLGGEICAFCQGSVDGDLGDKWRLRHIPTA